MAPAVSTLPGAADTVTCNGSHSRELNQTEPNNLILFCLRPQQENPQRHPRIHHHSPKSQSLDGLLALLRHRQQHAPPPRCTLQRQVARTIQSACYWYLNFLQHRCFRRNPRHSPIYGRRLQHDLRWRLRRTQQANQILNKINGSAGRAKRIGRSSQGEKDVQHEQGEAGRVRRSGQS